MSADTPVLDIIDALFALPDGLTEFAGFQISYGSPETTETDYYAVGFNGDEEAEIIRSEVDLIDPGLGMHEISEIDFQISVWEGATYDPVAVTTKAYDALNALNRAFRTDKTLGDTCMNAYVVRHNLVQTPIGEGSTATIKGTFKTESWRK